VKRADWIIETEDAYHHPLSREVRVMGRVQPECSINDRQRGWITRGLTLGEHSFGRDCTRWDPLKRLQNISKKVRTELFERRSLQGTELTALAKRKYPSWFTSRRKANMRVKERAKRKLEKRYTWANVEKCRSLRKFVKFRYVRRMSNIRPHLNKSSW